MDQNILTTLYRLKLLTSLDVRFALFLGRLSHTDDPDILLAAALTSNATGNKHICLDLGAMADKVLSGSHQDMSEKFQCPSVSLWRDKLLASPLVGVPGELRPLILDTQNRMYLYRYWQYETFLAKRIFERIHGALLSVDTLRLHESLNRYFPPMENTETISYPRAAITACFKRFCVITGGPGTGKTTVIAKILAVLVEQNPEARLRILLCAPTGKSAARLGESIQRIVATLDCPTLIRDAVLSRPKTIHRLLKPLPGSSSSFFHGPERPLPADVVVVDEASMIDAALMSKLVSAIPESARLILVGDKNQLASVEAGSVFGDICGSHSEHGCSEAWDKILHKVVINSLTTYDLNLSNAWNGSDCMVTLNHRFRFDESSGIDKLSRAVEMGDARQVRRVFDDSRYKGLRFENTISRQSLNEILERKIITGYREYLIENDPGIALEKLNAFKILCALRRGAFGVEGVNQFAEAVLTSAKLIFPAEEWYAGRPILITKNDYQLALFNGDMGIIRYGTDGKGLFACFPSEDGGIRYISPYRLPDHETAYAMTVHKSQGSEFESVLLILPNADSDILTRELLYTGISRARSDITVCGVDAVFNTALTRTIKRNSGLRDAIWN